MSMSYYFLLTVIVYVEGNIKFPCPTPLCECNNTKAICSGENLTYIPRLPDRITKVTLTNGNIRILSKELIENLTFNRRIGQVNFIGNRIFEIKPDTFANLTLIQALTFASEYSLSVHEVRDALKDIYKISNKLVKLDLLDNRWPILPDDMFMFSKANNIRKINLKNNYIKVLNLSWFSDVKRLTYLDVTFNEITQIIHGRMLNLRHLFLGNNAINELPEFCTKHGNHSIFPNLLELSFNNNKISKLGKFRCLSRLKSLILNENPIKVIHSDTFTELQHLENLDLIDLGRPLVKIEEGAFNISSLKKLSLRECHFHFNRLSKLKLSKLFASCHQLESLDLGYNYSNSTSLTLLLYSLTKLVTLNVEATRLNNLPENIFSNMQYLNKLTLRNNQIHSWDGSKVFSNISSITYLDLRENLITIIDETSFPQPLLENLEKINLAYNQFSCTCKLMWFVNWIRKAKITIKQYPYHYNCSQPAELSHVLLKDYNPTIESCTPWDPLFTIAISMCTFGSLIIAALCFFLKCHINIKKYVYLLRVKHRKRHGYLPIENKDDYQFHAFVVYCEVNRIWVHNNFVKRLENEEGFKFCIHHRDFVAGATITANIDTFLKKSRKVVVIMSNAFAKSEWCQWETDIVQERRRQQGRNALVLIMLENINSKNMTSPLRTLLNSTPYIRFKKGMGEDLFWKAVVEGLRKAIGQPPVSVL